MRYAICFRNDLTSCLFQFAELIKFVWTTLHILRRRYSILVNGLSIVENLERISHSADSVLSKFMSEIAPIASNIEGITLGEVGLVVAGSFLY